MNAADNKVSLEIPLNTQMKIFAFLFKENYSMSELFSGTREVGYYGESQPFSIDEQTNNLSLGISLQSTDTTTGDGDGADPDPDPDTGTEPGDTTAPIIEQVTAITSLTSDPTPEYIFRSTKAGSITYGGSCDSATIIANIGDNTIVFYALSDGYYDDCTIKIIDSEGNESNSLTIPPFTVNTTVPDTTAPTVTFSPANGDEDEAISDNITITFSEAVRNIDNTELTNSDLGSLITLKLDDASGNNVTFDATINANKTVITINPASNLPHSQDVYVAIGATVEDSAGNSITATSSTYTTEGLTQTTATAPNGSGSSGDPYLISNLAELSYISQNMGTTDYWAADVYLKQTANIDASATQYWDDADGDSDGDLYNDTNDITSTGSNEGFSPIGNLSTRFYGNYDGDNFTISGMTINRTYPSSGNEIGMFGWAQNGTIKDLTLSNMVVTATSVASFYGVGMLMGGGGSGIISNITISGGSLTSSGSYGYVGPLAGRYSKGTISNSTSSASVSFTYTGSSSTSNIGGLIGYISASSPDNYTISNSSATGSVTVSNTSGNVTRVGGFAGTLSGTGTVDRCFSSGTVTSNNGGYVGGFVGNPYEVVITDSYTVSNISVAATSSVGGFFSSSPTGSTNKPTFTRTYAAGTITGGSAGGFGGQSNYTNTYTDSFWDTDTTGNTIAVPNDKEGNLTGKTTAEMKTLATFTDIATTGLSTTWDFDTIWNIDTSGTINNGYPYLR